jgi:rifampicin phosphotransferase
VSGELGEMIIDANFGLGESVVSGEAEVDHWVLDKTTLAVRHVRIARKTHCVVEAGASGGTREAEIGNAHATRPSLTDSQLRDVGALLVRVEGSYGFPQDIEWGIAGDRLWVLQSRPVTTIPPRWTRDESAERFPNVISPLTWDFVEEGFHRSLNHSFRLMGFPAFNGKWFGLHGHYVYGNQNAVELYARRAPFTPPRSLDDLRALIPVLRQNFGWVQELPVAWHRDLDYYLLKIGEFMAEPLAMKTPRELWDFVLRVNAHGANYFLPNIAISISHGLLYRFLHGLLQLAAGHAAAAGLFDRLLAHCETKTGIINRELFELAQIVRREPMLERALTTSGSRMLLAAGALDLWPEFWARFEKFLRDHGHREIEFDAYAPTWLEAPWVVLDNIRLFLQSQLDATPAARERELKIRQQQAELELYATLPPDVHFFFGEILRLTRLYTSLDDLEHYQTTRLTLPLRRGLHELGVRLVASGVLAEPMDIFFARQSQIDAAIRADAEVSWRELAACVRAQKVSYLAAKTDPPAWTFPPPRGNGKGSHPNGSAPARASVLTGIAGSAGVAEGPVYLVLSSDDFAAFPKNAVLVARTTNPTWTPLFYNAAAIITESGGPLSHGAVTAREMRLPAVMAVKGSLTRLRNGQRVRVDGGAGEVTIL